MKILFLCSSRNTSRSLMAEAFLREIDHSLEVFSASIYPDLQTDPIAVEVMSETGIDISQMKPRRYTEFEGVVIDYLITLCGGSNEKLATMNLQALHKMHIGFDDPGNAQGSAENIINIYRNIRDEIRNELNYLYQHILSAKASVK